MGCSIRYEVHCTGLDPKQSDMKPASRPWLRQNPSLSVVCMWPRLAVACLSGYVEVILMGDEAHSSLTSESKESFFFCVFSSQ